ncbi:MAG TPA: serine/threonine-protein kinase, partial [Minicystis sp.]|nr:serine/threonine-protein kinase [Minicystis sp.]
MRSNANQVKALLERPGAERRIGPFVLLEQLGRGGFAPVWLAQETYGATELRTAAVKLFSLHDADRQRIVEEARALCRVEHPNVVRFYALAIDDDAEVAGVAMEHVAGTPLDARLARDGRLAVPDALDVGVAIASALSAVHRAGLVHRDVKPANVIDAGGVYKLIDFGIAAADPRDAAGGSARVELGDVSGALRGASPSLLQRDRRMNSGTRDAPTAPLGGVFGTVGYVDPTCVATRAPATAASDLYALGAMIFECVAGRVPAAAAASPGLLSGEVLDGRRTPPSLAELEPTTPPALARLVAALLEPSRDGRPVSAEWVATELERVRTELEGRRRALPPEDVGPFRGLGRVEPADRAVYFGR